MQKKINKYSKQEIELIRDAMLFYVEEHIAEREHGFSSDNAWKCYNKLMEEFEE